MTRDELISKIKDIARTKLLDTPEVEVDAVEYDELTKFPELRDALVDLLTIDFSNFVSSIDWVAPRPSLFRINLKNNREFYLSYNKQSWTAQIEGKKYYLNSLPEEQRAADSISRILKYQEGEEIKDDLLDAGPIDDEPLPGGDLGDEGLEGEEPQEEPTDNEPTPEI